jgi:hypothetical protein
VARSFYEKKSPPPAHDPVTTRETIAVEGMRKTKSIDRYPSPGCVFTWEQVFFFLLSAQKNVRGQVSNFKYGPSHSPIAIREDASPPPFLESG